MRSIGGPVANALAGLHFFLLRFLTPSWWGLRTGPTLLGWFNSLLVVSSLFPLSFIDGGVILKWTLVEHGQSSEQADRMVWHAGFIASGLVVLPGLFLAKQRKWRFK
ncbi:MAG: hypothetical protein KJ077_22135 [Anaerolineae bacterium]|nr:hypothetical protein [Anaerolineae bacterium]